MELFAPGPMCARAALAPLIGVVTAVSRQGRLCDIPAHWLYGIAGDRGDLRVELIDLGDLLWPFFHDARVGVTARGRAGRWADVFDRLDGLVVILPDAELPGTGSVLRSTALRRSLSQKPVAFVQCGAAAVPPCMHALASRLGMMPTALSVGISRQEMTGIRDMRQGFEDFPHLAQAAHRMFDALGGSARALRMVRAQPATNSAAQAPPMRSAVSAGVARILREWREWRESFRAFQRTASDSNPRIARRCRSI